MGWQLWKRTTNRALTTTYWRGLRVRVHPDSRSAGLALYTRLPEYDDMLFTERFLQPHDVVIDVGANIGLYSLLAASKVVEGRVIALEPHPQTADRLRENVVLNRLRNVDVRSVAAGASAGMARLTSNLDTVNHIVIDSITADAIRVPVRTLDSLVSSGEEIALIKVDAEGFESDVLAGASSLLANHAVAAWIVEVTGLGGRYGSDDRTVLDTFERAGYLPFRYSADEHRLLPTRSPAGEAEWNLIFVRDVTETELRLESG